MKLIIELSPGPSRLNMQKTLSFAGQKFRYERWGTDFCLETLLFLVKQFSEKADALALSGVPASFMAGGQEVSHKLLPMIHKQAGDALVCDGQQLRALYTPWALRKYAQTNPEAFVSKNIFFLAGIIQRGLLDSIEDLFGKKFYGDSFFLCNKDHVIESKSELDTLIKKNIRKLEGLGPEDFLGKDYKKGSEQYKNLGKALNHSSIIMANSTFIDSVTLPPLDGKTVIVDLLTPTAQKKLKDANAHSIISCLGPTPGNPETSPPSYACFEAIIKLINGPKRPLTQSEVIRFVNQHDLRPYHRPPIKAKYSPRKFGFIIHPLFAKQIMTSPLIRPLGPLADKGIGLVERSMQFVPGMRYGKISGIHSLNGEQTEGHLYCLLETPKMLMQSAPEKIYKKLIKLTHMAQDDGCQIVGLGAYTKVVGDAGVTVAKHSPIPVTTGNSLSTTSTLWAAAWAVEELGLVEKDAEGKYIDSCMVIGATGSIGKACAKILSRRWKRLILVAPRAHKLLEVQEEIQDMVGNDCEILFETAPDKYIKECGLIITSTSAQGKRVVDIQLPRPGAVICDVSRPLDIPEEDALKRPDILVISSGEVILPGPVHMNCNIGLEGKAVYACLAETALLALEGRFESFSLSRDLCPEKIIEIDRLARKHGVQLATIMGHRTVISEKEVALCKEHALKELESREVTPLHSSKVEKVTTEFL